MLRTYAAVKRNRRRQLLLLLLMMMMSLRHKTKCALASCSHVSSLSSSLKTSRQPAPWPSLDEHQPLLRRYEVLLRINITSIIKNFKRSKLHQAYFYSNHSRRGVVYNFGRVCLSDCQTITFESLVVASSCLHIRCISREYGSSSYMKVIGSRSRSQELNSRKSLFSQCKNLIRIIPVPHREP